MTQLADFLTLTTPTRLAEGIFTTEIPDGWQQGRGAFGGLVLANLVRAVRSCEPETDRTLRTLSAELVGPVLPGTAQIRVEMLRRGTGVSTMAARLVQGEELLAHAVMVLGRKRSGRSSTSKAIDGVNPAAAHSSSTVSRIPDGARRMMNGSPATSARSTDVDSARR